LSKDPTVIGLITARGGSKGIPGKNIKMAAGKPLIEWTIQAALESQLLCRVIVSTDDDAIATVALSAKAEVPFLRPKELAGDASPHILTTEHAIQWLHEQEDCQPDYILLLQPTSPLRTASDIDGAIRLAIDRNASDVVSVCEAQHHPFLTYRLGDDGTLSPLVQTEIGYLRRQDLPTAYATNGAIYLNKRESLLQRRCHTPPGTLAYVMPQHRSLDVDTAWDFLVAELLLENRLRWPEPP
jgi:CMP-N,N'-diacetyllegionaminic acid synthase